MTLALWPRKLIQYYRHVVFLHSDQTSFNLTSNSFSIPTANNTAAAQRQIKKKRKFDGKVLFTSTEALLEVRYVAGLILLSGRNCIITWRHLP